MKTYIRRFNEIGLDKFRETLQAIKNEELEDIPSALLTDSYATEVIRTDVQLQNKIFSSKETLVKYIYEYISNFLNSTWLYDKGLWTWLAAYYFDSICPENDGVRKIGAESRYILNSDEWNRYYRHLLAAPIRLYHDLGTLSKIYLVGKPDVPGELFEQLASRQEIAACKGIIEAAELLFWDSQKNSIKKGVRGKGEGSVRRLAGATILQFQMTYDLNSMSGNDVIQLLPPEYDKWKAG
jgi:hypothetical protein